MIFVLLQSLSCIFFLFFSEPAVPQVLDKFSKLNAPYQALPECFVVWLPRLGEYNEALFKFKNEQSTLKLNFFY